MGEIESATNRTKADEVIAQLISSEDGLLKRLQSSRNRDSMEVAIVTFDTRTHTLLPKVLSQVDTNDLNIRLLAKHGGDTGMGTALSEANNIAQQWLSHADPRIARFVTILVMTDGQETAGTDPLGVAAAIKAQVTYPDGNRPSIVIATAAYGDNADENTLRAMATQQPDGYTFFKKVHSGEDLREFMLQSIIMASAPSAARPVTTIV
jgi:uncharacterized protein YegL